jgi:hypothetical protein
VVRRCVWSRNLKNEDAMTHVGSQRHKKKILKTKFETVNPYKPNVSKDIPNIRFCAIYIHSLFSEYESFALLLCHLSALYSKLVKRTVNKSKIWTAEQHVVLTFKNRASYI